MKPRIPQDIDLEVNFFTKGVPERQIENVRRPNDHGEALEFNPEGRIAARVIAALDKTGYSREQVHAIAHWILYLSTQI